MAQMQSAAVWHRICSRVWLSSLVVGIIISNVFDVDLKMLVPYMGFRSDRRLSWRAQEGLSPPVPYVVPDGDNQNEWGNTSYHVVEYIDEDIQGGC